MEKFDIQSAPLEIERKFLIRYPDIAALQRMPGYRVLHMEQTYLHADADFIGGRIRRIAEGDSVRYIYTYKEKLTEMTRREYERELTEQEYRDLMPRKEPQSMTIRKDRHCFLYADLLYELDVYEFWDDQATLEAEVKSESTPIPVPPCVELIKEVTGDARYNNSRLAFNHGVIC